MLARHELPELTSLGESRPRPEGTGMAPSGAYAAQFVEVRVDKDLGLVRVARVVSAIDGGRVLNEKTAHSQIMGSIVMGIGMALPEETSFHRGTGRIAKLADYLTPVNADVPTLDVVFVGDPGRFNPIGTKGLGSSASPQPSRTPSTMRPEGASGRCPSQSTSSCSRSTAGTSTPRRFTLYLATSSCESGSRRYA